MKTGPVKPLVAFSAASSRLWILPDFSSIARLTGMLATRLVSWRGAQKESWICTWVKGTPRSFTNAGSAFAPELRTAAAPIRYQTAENGFVRISISQKSQQSRTRLDDSQAVFRQRSDQAPALGPSPLPRGW